LQKDELKRRALSIVPLPSHYELIIEEYSEDGRVMFSWANEQQDESMTGLIDYYSGPNFDLDELRQMPTVPAISLEKAYRRFLENIDFQLVWDKNYDNEIESYQLIYQACDRQTKLPIRNIDATTGEIIVSNV